MMVAAPSAHPAAAMAVVAPTIPEEADADCSGLINEFSMRIGGVWGSGLSVRSPVTVWIYPKSDRSVCQFLGKR